MTTNELYAAETIARELGAKGGLDELRSGVRGWTGRPVREIDVTVAACGFRVRLTRMFPSVTEPEWGRRDSVTVEGARADVVAEAKATLARWDEEREVARRGLEERRRRARRAA